MKSKISCAVEQILGSEKTMSAKSLGSDVTQIRVDFRKPEPLKLFSELSRIPVQFENFY